MYNGIGLTTPRGSGTNGYVQRNLATSFKPKDKNIFKSQNEVNTPSIKKPNTEIIEHDRKRKIEIKFIEFEQMLEDQGSRSTSVTKEEKHRKKSSSKYDKKKNKDSSPPRSKSKKSKKDRDASSSEEAHKSKKRYNTTALLQEVVARLSSRTGNKHTISTESTHGFIMSEKGKKLAKTIQDHFVEILGNISEAKPNDPSMLFAIADYILVEASGCIPFVADCNKDWPCNFTYKSEVHGYQCLNHILEMSILTENDVTSPSKYYYLCFSFPEGNHIYHVEEIPVKWVPTFVAGNEENDLLSVQYLYLIIQQVFDSFCLEFVETGKFRAREFSSCGIKPIFSDSIKCSKKRKRAIPVLPYDKTKLTPVTPTFYRRLCDLFRKMDSKPNAHSRLFSVIHEILTFFCACKTSTKEDEWPGGVAYDSDVIQVWVPDPESQLEVQYCIFNLSLLKNEKEFYCCLRFTEDHTKKCIKKVADTLVPTFNPSETQKDRERITNLNAWLSAIIREFVRKVIVGSYSSQNISFVSLSSTVSQSGDVSSADESE